MMANRILVVDSDPITLHILVGMLKSKSNFFDVLPAQNIQTALEILDQKKIHVLITGMHIPESDAFKLSLLLSNNLKVRVIVITDNASASFSEKIRNLPSVIHFNKVIDINLLTRRIFTELQIDYGGQIRGLSLSSLLQVFELDSRSCTLLVSAKGKTGTIYLSEGRPTAARAGDLTGVAAVLHILNWQNVLIDLDYRPREMTIEINTPLMTLLLESGQVMDEDLSQRQNLRQHSRYSCLMGVEFRLKKTDYHCYMYDLSEGGAYLETNQSVEIGQQITLFLQSPLLEQSCAIDGVVVRKDKMGMGVQFEPVTMEQKHIIRSLIESCCVPIPNPTD